MPISQSTYTSLVTAKSASWSSNFYSLSTAKLASTFADYTVNFIQTLSGFSASNVLMATSICADDVCALSASGNIGQFPREAMKFLGPFSSSGLAGYPHYGITGVFAWATHITDGGALFLLVAPHIGVTSYGSVGQIIRRGQTSPSSTCGAIGVAVSAVVAASTLPLSGSNNNSWTGANWHPDDFQQWTLTKELYPLRTTLSSATTANQMLIATKTILDAASAVITNVVVPSAYNAYFTGGSTVTSRTTPIFTCFGTFVNVDDGYQAYIAPIAFKRYDGVTGWVDYTASYLSGLSSLT